MLKFEQAVIICLRDKYADFSGRAPRSEFWWFVLFGILLTLGAALADQLIFDAPLLQTAAVETETTAPLTLGLFELAAALALLLPNIAVTVRRLHDLGYSGWWYVAYVAVISLLFSTALTTQNVSVLLLCVIFYIVFVIIMAQRGTRGANAFGADPLAGAGEGGQQ